jgi:hypothetical protein
MEMATNTRNIQDAKIFVAEIVGAEKTVSEKRSKRAW